MRTALVVLASLVCAGGASAKTTASVSLTNFRYILADLDLNDGIDPSLSFAPATAVTSSGAATVEETFSADVTHNTAAGLEAFGPLSVSAASARGSSSGSIGGTLELLSMQAASTLTAADGQGNAAYTTLDTGYRGFTLSPMTSVTFIGDVVLNAAFPATGADLIGGSSVASAWLYLGADVNGAADYFDTGLRLSSADNGPPSLSGPLTFTLANALGSSTSNELKLTAMSDVRASYATAAPVPEPASWAMLLAGAGVLGSVAWRRRRVLSGPVTRPQPHVPGRHR